MLKRLKKYFPQSLINNYHLMLALVANIYYGFPSRKIRLIGITGTKGKTTTANYLYQLLKKKYRTGLISTTAVIIGKHSLDIAPHTTTPSPFELQKIIKSAVRQRIEYLVIETSSHGFDQNRLWGLRFDVGIVTNIDNDHLDYHLTWDKYAQAKAKLIKQLKPDGLIILNLDNRKSFTFLKKIANQYHKTIITYGVDNPKADFSAHALTNTFEHLKFTSVGLDSKEEQYLLNTFGVFNLYNALAALVTAKHLKMSYLQISGVLKKIISPPGRMEIIQKNPFIIIVDFAHNAYSLETAMQNLLALKNPSSRLISVFGCPGQRDHNRRKMGYISARYSNLTIITIDDPRDEGVEKISLEIENWAKKGKAQLLKTKNLSSKDHFYTKIEKRRDAIKFAIDIAKKNDIVYITGMGDQHTMAVGDGEIDWNDKKEIKKLLIEKTNAY